MPRTTLNIEQPVLKELKLLQKQSGKPLGALGLTLLACVGLLLIGCGGKPAEPSKTPIVADIKIVNESQPGESLDLAPHLAKDKTTLVEYYSDHCGPCQQMKPIMEFLAANRGDLAIRKVNIDRKGISGIDFDSPVAQQHNIHSVPCFEVYDPSGKLTARDKHAKDLVRDWYNTAQQFQRGEKDPGTRKIMDDYEKK